MFPFDKSGEGSFWVLETDLEVVSEVVLLVASEMFFWLPQATKDMRHVERNTFFICFCFEEKSVTALYFCLNKYIISSK